MKELIDRGGCIELARRKCVDKGEVKAHLSWPFHWGTFPEGTRHQRL